MISLHVHREWNAESRPKNNLDFYFYLQFGEVIEVIGSFSEVVIIVIVEVQGGRGWNEMVEGCKFELIFEYIFLSIPAVTNVKRTMTSVTPDLISFDAMMRRYKTPFCGDLLSDERRGKSSGVVDEVSQDIVAIDVTDDEVAFELQDQTGEVKCENFPLFWTQFQGLFRFFTNLYDILKKRFNLFIFA